LTKLRAKHAESPGCSFGINGDTGDIVDMKELGIWEPLAVKLQTIKTAIDSAKMLLRIDDIVSGMTKRREAPKQKKSEVEEEPTDVDSERMIQE
jgi:T-complex protein 1 subunit gamma